MKIFIAFLLVCAVAFGDRDGGPYLGIGYGVSKYNDDGLYEKLKKDESNALKIYAGAYINKYLSVALGYVSFDAFGTDSGYEDDAKKSLVASVLSVSTLAHYPFFDDTLDVYAKFGVGELAVSALSSNGFTFVVGAGVGYRFDEKYSLKIAYDMCSFNYEERDQNSITSYDMHIGYLYNAIEVQF